MYNQPKRAKRLFFDVIPRMVDDYVTHLDRFHDEAPEKQIENPVWHIHMGQPPQETTPVSFSLLLNLAGVCQAEEPAVIWAYLGQYAPGFRLKAIPCWRGLWNMLSPIIRKWCGLANPGVQQMPMKPKR